jgi:hypothetical protein
MLNQYQRMRREDSTVTGRLLYQRILSQHSGFTAEGAATVLTGAGESYCSWPVHRELRFRDVVSYVVAQEYLCSHNFLRGTQTDIRRVVARIIPEEL